MMKMQMNRSLTQVMLCHCCCTTVCIAMEHYPHGRWHCFTSYLLHAHCARF